MGARFKAHVFVGNQWFKPGDPVPAELADQVTNPKAYEDDGEVVSPADPKPAGNASTEAWQEYARTKGATDADLDGKSRDALREAYGN